MLLECIIHPDCGACSGDFGIGLFGHLQLSAAYLLWASQAWQCYLCNINSPIASGPISSSTISDTAWAAFSTASNVQLRSTAFWQRIWHAARCQLDARHCHTNGPTQIDTGRSQGELKPVIVRPVDAVRQRLYVEPLGSLFTVQGGTVQLLTYDDGVWEIHMEQHASALGASGLELSWAHCATSRLLGSHLRLIASSQVEVSQTDRCS